VPSRVFLLQRTLNPASHAAQQARPSQQEESKAVDMVRPCIQGWLLLLLLLEACGWLLPRVAKAMSASIIPAQLSTMSFAVSTWCAATAEAAVRVAAAAAAAARQVN
jgi:hypothetical protein